MSEGDYEYELMRSELLGLPPPEKKPLPPVSPNDENNLDEDDAEANENVELEGEQLGRVSGGLDELNSILNITQKKINRFKTVCGSFTNLLKLRVGSKNDGATSECSSQSSEPDSVPLTEEATIVSDSGGETTEDKAVVGAKKTPMPRDVDLEGKLCSQLDKLDTMLMKAEQAELSMSKQNKEMRIVLNKFVEILMKINTKVFFNEKMIFRLDE